MGSDLVMRTNIVCGSSSEIVLRYGKIYFFKVNNKFDEFISVV